MFTILDYTVKLSMTKLEYYLKMFSGKDLLPNRSGNTLFPLPGTEYHTIPKSPVFGPIFGCLSP